MLTNSFRLFFQQNRRTHCTQRDRLRSTCEVYQWEQQVSEKKKKDTRFGSLVGLLINCVVEPLPIGGFSQKSTLLIYRLCFLMVNQ